MTRSGSPKPSIATYVAFALQTEVAGTDMETMTLATAAYGIVCHWWKPRRSSVDRFLVEPSYPPAFFAHR
jgi:hypothetical protein